MKVLMVISQFSPLIGGAEKQAQLLAKILVRSGIDVSIVTGWWKFGTAHKEKIDGIHIFRNFACWGMFGIKGLRPIGVVVYAISLGIFLLVHRNRFDIIHVHQALYPAFIAVLVGKRILKKPVMVKSASSGMTGDITWMKGFPFGTFELRYVLKYVDYLIAVSKATGLEFEAIGFPKGKLLYIPNGVEIPEERKINFSLLNRVVTVARLSLEKGVDVLLSAFAICRRKRKDLKLIVVGDGPLKSELKAASRSSGIEDSVEFTGTRIDIKGCLKSADIFVLPSRTEGMPNALLEAMSYGLPCIATNVGGNSELLGLVKQSISAGEFVLGRNGLLVNSEDIKGLSKAVLCLAEDLHLRKALGERSQQFIKDNYSIETVADRYIELYRKLLTKETSHVRHLRID
jgi:L-malate glycosyltransferase